jgi:ABC-type glycerol-3-phosphate transport system substrate-binding protein
MKKLFAILFIAAAVTACNNSSDKKAEDAKDTTVKVVDTTAKMPDTSANKMMDTATKMTDTTKTKM